MSTRLIALIMFCASCTLSQDPPEHTDAGTTETGAMPVPACEPDAFRPAAPNDRCAPRCVDDSDCASDESCQPATSDASIEVCWSKTDPLPFACPYGCLRCVGIERAPTGDLATDLVGTWVHDSVPIDWYNSILVFRADGTHTSIAPNEDPREPEEVIFLERPWHVEGDALLFNDRVEPWARVRQVGPSSINFREEDYVLPLFRVACTGVGFDADELPAETRCDDEPTDFCETTLGEGATCMTYPDYWGEVALCAFPVDIPF